MRERAVMDDGKFLFTTERDISAMDRGLDRIWGLTRNILRFNGMRHWNRAWNLEERDRNNIVSYVNANGIMQVGIYHAMSAGMERFAVIKTVPDERKRLGLDNLLVSFKMDHTSAALDFRIRAMELARRALIESDDQQYRSAMLGYMHLLRKSIAKLARNPRAHEEGSAP